MDWANVTKVYTSSSANLSRLSCFPKIWKFRKFLVLFHLAFLPNLSRLSCFPKIWKFRKFLVLFHLAFLPGMILSPSRKLLPCRKLQNGAESTLHWMQNHLLQLHPVPPCITFYYFFKDVRAKILYSIDFFLNFYCGQMMIYLFQKWNKNWMSPSSFER